MCACYCHGVVRVHICVTPGAVLGHPRTSCLCIQAPQLLDATCLQTPCPTPQIKTPKLPDVSPHHHWQTPSPRGQHSPHGQGGGGLGGPGSPHGGQAIPGHAFGRSNSGAYGYPLRLSMPPHAISSRGYMGSAQSAGTLYQQLQALAGVHGQGPQAGGHRGSWVVDRVRIEALDEADLVREFSRTLPAIGPKGLKPAEIDAEVAAVTGGIGTGGTGRSGGRSGGRSPVPSAEGGAPAAGASAGSTEAGAPGPAPGESGAGAEAGTTAAGSASPSQGVGQPEGGGAGAAAGAGAGAGPLGPEASTGSHASKAKTLPVVKVSKQQQFKVGG